MNSFSETIRESGADDLDDILTLYRDLHPDDPVPDSGLADRIYNRILANDFFKILLLQRDESVVATCSISIIPNLTRGGRPYAVIENVVTRTGMRRQGLGSKIIRHAIAVAEKNNCYKIMLLTGSGKEATHRFYQKLGFSGADKTAYTIKKAVPEPRY